MLVICILLTPYTMCVYNGRKVSYAEWIRLKSLEKELKNAMDNPVGYGYDYIDWPIVRPNAEGQLDISMAHWEFIPSVVERRQHLPTFRTKFNTLNARGETLFDGMYRFAAQQRRCLVLSSHFFEHRHLGPKRIPYRVSVKGQEYFYMAGIWQPWLDKGSGQRINTFSIITTEANSLMAQIHNSELRMPTILTEDMAYDWLLKPLTPSQITALATYQFPAPAMEAWTVGRDFRISTDPEKYVHYGQVPPLVDGVRHTPTVWQQSLFDAM